MAATLEKININGVEVPVIYEESKLVPAFNLKLIFTNGGELGTFMSSKKDYASSITDLGSAILEEGTKQLGSVKFAQELEERSITLSSDSGRESLSISLSALKEDMGDALGYLDALLRSPNLTPKALNKVKEDAIANILQKEADFDEIANDELTKILFKGTPCAYIPTQKSIQKVTLKDIEEYYKRHIVLSGLVILAGGDVSFKEFEKRIQPILSNFKKGNTYPIQKCTLAQTKENIITKKPTEQAYVYFGSPLTIQDYAKEAYKMRVAAFVLGAGGFGSRLLEEVRVKRGLAYSAYWHAYNTKSATYGLGYLQTKLDNKDEAIQVVKEVISDFIQKGITQEELDAAKKFLLGSEPLRNETLSQRLSKAYNAYYFGQPLDFGIQELANIERLQLEDINAYIKQHREILDLSFSIVEK
ncbi:peptidase M16 [Helicobacter monodelphidis]|uniref:M16 family metallopeptidase n=1 Tax=Helicobacter sp. 15-1451 TaxID=2004995 RepID=UPI000DCEC839|nr:pitrilysin family protein [Helicobacter sp. 15-1451]RAX58971.1 peptidase M16 [Helicobacter sp. 15-1451]